MIVLALIVCNPLWFRSSEKLPIMNGCSAVEGLIFGIGFQRSSFIGNYPFLLILVLHFPRLNLELLMKHKMKQMIENFYLPPSLMQWINII